LRYDIHKVFLLRIRNNCHSSGRPEGRIYLEDLGVDEKII